MHKEGLDTAKAFNDGLDDMLAGAALEVEVETGIDGTDQDFIEDGSDDEATVDGDLEDEAFNDGDDVHLAAVSVQDEIHNIFGIQAPGVNYEDSSSGDDEVKIDCDDDGKAITNDEDKDFMDGDDYHLVAASIQAEIQNDLGIGAPGVNFEISSSSEDDGDGISSRDDVNNHLIEDSN